MSDDSKLPPMRDLTSIDQVRNRFATEDIELTCRKRVEVEIIIFHPTDDDGRPVFGENIVSLRFKGHRDDSQEEHWIDWTTLIPLDHIADALAVKRDEEIWSIAAGPSELERRAIRNAPCPHCSSAALLLADLETEMEPATGNIIALAVSAPSLSTSLVGSSQQSNSRHR